MTQSERRRFLIKYLLNESPHYKNVEIPEDEAGQKSLLRSLMNVREPLPVTDEFLRIQDEYLQETNRSHGITDIAELEPVGGFDPSTELRDRTTENVQRSTICHEYGILVQVLAACRKMFLKNVLLK